LYCPIGLVSQSLWLGEERSPCCGLRKQTNKMPPHRALVPCAEVHPWVPSCYKMWVWQILVSTKSAFGIYAPIFIVSTILFRRKKLSLKELVVRTAPEILRSSLFVGVFGCFFWMTICTLRKVRQHDFKANFWLGGFVGGLASIFVERKSRRTELTTYCINQVMENLLKVAEHYNYFKLPKSADVFIFMIANSILMYMYQNEQHNLRGSAHSMLKFLMKTN